MILNLDSHLNPLENFLKILIPGHPPPQTNDIRLSRSKAPARAFLQSSPNDFNAQLQLRTALLSAAKVTENVLEHRWDN